jgi:hypothetical protein
MPDGPYRDEVVVEIVSLNGEHFIGTVTPSEARKKIFEDMLGFHQSDLASITIGFNRGLIITYKLKQQFNIDLLYEWREFEIERNNGPGKEASVLACTIRGLRNPANRPDYVRNATKSNTPAPYLDDGTRMVRIIGCEYRLSESEILNWLGMFGEIISEITEEPYDEEGHKDDSMPLVGNGTYNILMRLSSDLPNWVPIYGKKICLEYKGMRRQCNNCYGPHIRRYCKSERASIEELASKIRVKYPNIPEEYYGRLAKINKVQAQEANATPAVIIPQVQTQVGGHKAVSAALATHAAVPIALQTEQRYSKKQGNTKVTNEQPSNNQSLRLSFRKDPNSGWLPRVSEENRTGVVGDAAGSRATETAVNSMLGAIRATFGIGQQPIHRQEQHEVQNDQQRQSVQGVLGGGKATTDTSEIVTVSKIRGRVSKPQL